MEHGQLVEGVTSDFAAQLHAEIAGSSDLSLQLVDSENFEVDQVPRHSDFSIDLGQGVGNMALGTKVAVAPPESQNHIALAVEEGQTENQTTTSSYPDCWGCWYDPADVGLPPAG